MAGENIKGYSRRALRDAAVWGSLMTAGGFRHVYGPVPSRRLGRSIGVDLVPFKTCSYDCIYCQLGRTTRKTVERKEYVPIGEVLSELERKLSEADKPTYISLAGSGEPTLNSGIGDLIAKIKRLTDIPVAVLTNGSLLSDNEVRDALMAADLVLPSLDAGDGRLFRYINRPHEAICFETMVAGIAAFTRRFPGEVWLEVFLLGGVTDISSEIKKIAAGVRRIRPARVQVNTVSRPPAENFAFPLSSDQTIALKDCFPEPVELIGRHEREGAHSGFSTHVRDGDIVALLARRPCTLMDVASGLGMHVQEAIKHLEALIAAGKVKTAVAGRRSFYTKKDSAEASATSKEDREQ
ncbi:MAG: radical SAM protein [Syntrophales bacterium]|jgi:wyosine [tRNA(Phe)-imidazoG37] synthetase (radical SAM superfamily)|nr:radical SAM protein [Syntrophales bacterium]